MAFYKCISNDIFCQKIEIIYSVEETRELMYKITSNFKVHLYNIFWQYSELRYLTCNLDNNGAILSVHFSGNYKNKQQSEIQYIYFGHWSVFFVESWILLKGKLSDENMRSTKDKDTGLSCHLVITVVITTIILYQLWSSSPFQSSPWWDWGFS